MKYIYIAIFLIFPGLVNAGICKNENILEPYEAKGIENAILFYGFRKDLPDYRFTVRIENQVEFVPNFSEDRRALIDGNFYQFIEHDISVFDIPKNLKKHEILNQFKKYIINQITESGAEALETPICKSPCESSKEEFTSWKLDIKASGDRPALTQFYSATYLNGQIIALVTGMPYGEDTSKIEKSILYYISTFQIIESNSDCPNP